MASRDEMASINHRLELLDSVSHRVALIEELNARLIALEDRLMRNPVDLVLMKAVADKLEHVAVATADRLEAMERRLEQLSVQLRRSE
ncbi:hypothetical protein BH10ACT2_BH10ACT2_00290 [soil metagenome]